MSPSGSARTARGSSCTAATARAGEAVVERIAEERRRGAVPRGRPRLARRSPQARRGGAPRDATASTSSSTTPGSARPEARREVSADGFELRFAVNYLAGFLLTRLLLPLIEARAPSRIVNVASAGQQAIDFDDVMLTHGYSGVRAYCQSKLAQILFTIDLAEELKGRSVTVNALHPATYMDTTMVRKSGVRPMSTVEEGGDAILQLVASPALEGKSGLYFSGLREARADAQAYDAAARKRLRALSFELVGMADPAAAR